MLGTLFLSVLSGHWRFAHIAALRADGVSAALLGMNSVVSEDTVRRALKSMDEEAGVRWLQDHLDASVLPGEKRPALVRGDCGQGGEPTMAALEARNVHYLFKLRLTKNVKRYIKRMFATPEWTDAGQGWQGREGTIQLSGWSRSRRIVILRRLLQGEVLLTDERQIQLAFVEKDVPAKGYEYAVLVTDLTYDTQAIAQLYRHRGDAENAFDELKNQWVWGGFTTHDLKRCRFTAMTVALAYNWWSLFVRLAHPVARLVAITGRPLLLSGIGRLTSQSGQAHLSITPMHARAKQARALLTAVSERLKAWKETAEQLPIVSVWQRVCEFIVTQITGFNWPASRVRPHLTRCT